MKIIGLTGGIGAGKSTASDYLKSKGFPVIDADQIGRDLLQKDSPLLAQLANRFGEEILQGDGALDRKRLGAIVFDDPQKRKALDKIMHKEILQEIETRCNHYAQREQHPICFIDAPLLFETKLDERCHATWLLVADRQRIVERIQQRDGISPVEIQGRMDSQMSDAEKRPLATLVMENNGTKAQLYEKLAEELLLLHPH